MKKGFNAFESAFVMKLSVDEETFQPRFQNFINFVSVKLIENLKVPLPNY